MKRFFLQLALIVAAGCPTGAGLAAANLALPPCSKFPSGRIYIYPWTATLANGVMSAPLPSKDHTYYYFEFVVAEHDVKTYASPKTFFVVVPWNVAGIYRYHLSGKAEHANGRYYFTGVYVSGRDDEGAGADRQDTLEIVLSGRYCFDSSG